METASIKAEATASRPTLIRAIGRWALTAAVINGVVGSGVFGLPSTLAGFAGAWSPLTVLIAGVGILVIVLCFAEVASRFEEAGGPYLYTREAFGPAFGFQIGWLHIWTRLLSAAAVLNILSAYTAPLVPWAGTPTGRATVMIFTMALVTVINVIGVRQASWTINAFTIAKLLPLILVIVLGLIQFDRSVVQTQTVAEPEWTEAVLILMFGYGGFESGIVAGSESRDPRRDTAFALITSMVGVTLIYCLIQLAVVGVLPHAAETKAPIAETLRILLGPVGLTLGSIAVIISVYGWLMGFSLMASRIFYAMAARREFPEAFATVHPRFRTPHIAVILNSAIALSLGLASNFGQLATFGAITRLGIYIATCGALIALRKKFGQPETFRTPGGPILAVIGIAFGLWLLSTRKLDQAWLLPIVVLVGGIVWIVMRNRWHMTPRRHLISLTFLPLIAFATVESHAQEALVLSGGGSRGLAHVGVVIGLDSLHRDPDLVIGASMGAIVGSLYAAGYSSKEIHRFAREQDWRDLFKPVPVVLGPQREIHLPFLHWGIELGRFEVSRGFLPDWRINRRLVEYLFDPGARAGGNFDLLPRRFRSVAADRSDGDTVIISRGDLARSVRASMAEPGIFSPVLWNDRVLIDGGIADYLPVIVARHVGASTVIASDVARTELKGMPKDPIGLVRRALTLLMIRARQDTTLPDYLIVPEVDPNQSGLIYPDDVQPVIRLGIDATLHSVPRAATRPRTRPKRQQPDSLRRLVIETRDSSLAALARAVFQDAAPAKYSSARVLAAVDRMYASGFTESVWPRVDSSGALVVHIDSRPNGSLDASLGYDNDRGGRVWGSAQRRFSTIGAPTELELAGSITGLQQWGSLTVRRASLRLPPVVWAASGYLKETHARFVRDPDETREHEVARAGGWIGIERRAVFPDHIITASFLAERITDEGAARTSFGPLLTFGVPEASRVVGVTPVVEFETRFGEWDYSRAAGRASLGSSRSRFKFAVVADGAITDKDAPADVLPALGDDRAMPGMRWGQERGRARALGGFDAAYPIPLGGHARIRARAGAAPLTLRGFESSHNWVLGGEIGGVWSLPIGSIIVAGGFNSRGRSRFDILAGQVF